MDIDSVEQFTESHMKETLPGGINIKRNGYYTQSFEVKVGDGHNVDTKMLGVAKPNKLSDKNLAEMSEKLRTSLRTCSDVQLIVIKENSSKTMTLSIPYRDIWDCPLDMNIESIESYSHYGILTGVVQFDPSLVSANERVFVEVTAHCKYEKADLDPYDLNVRRKEYHDFRQIYPITTSNLDVTYKYPLVIRKMLTKFGPNSYLFRFDLRQGPDSLKFFDCNDEYHQNGIKWVVRTYISRQLALDTPADGISIEFRKLSFLWHTINSLGLKPNEECVRGFRSCCLDGGRVELSAEIDKEIYYFGQPIIVKVVMNNLSDRVIKAVRIALKQILTISSWTDRSEGRTIDQILITGEEMKLPILPGRKWSETHELYPGRTLIKSFTNLLVEAPPKLEPKEESPPNGTCWRQCILAPSTITQFIPPKKDTENRCIQPLVTNVFYSDPCMTVAYEVEVTCDIPPTCHLSAPLVITRIPFILAHPYPEILTGMLDSAKVIS